MRPTPGILILICALGLSACGERPLHELRKGGDGPDEFAILPGKPLEQPESFSALPAPTPGQANRTDQHPLKESVAELGGTRRDPGAGVPAGDVALVNHASRYGRSADIRAVLAEEDKAFRKRRGRFTSIKLPGVDRYKDVYRREALKPHEERDRWRRAGARTPSAPPSVYGQ